MITGKDYSSIASEPSDSKTQLIGLNKMKIEKEFLIVNNNSTLTCEIFIHENEKL
jgi:hypothetical protein